MREVAELVGRTEGWPVGLYLAALARNAGNRQHQTGFEFTGDDRFMADYLRSEFLAHLPPERVVFLTRTAVLERLSGPLCDAVLDTSGSDRALASLEDSNLLLVARTASHSGPDIRSSTAVRVKNVTSSDDRRASSSERR